MKILEIRIKNDNGKPLKAFADVELDSGIIIREFRIVQQPGLRPSVYCPQLSWKDPGTGLIKYKMVITFPNQLKGEIDLLILTAWNREKEKNSGSNLQR
jgi:DNA-binding cell septation regulator SpoVG